MCSVDLKPGDCEMVVDGGGHFSPAVVIDGVHTCLYYSRPIQHIAVPRVIQYNTYYTDILRPLIDTEREYRNLTNTGGYELRPPMSNA